MMSPNLIAFGSWPRITIRAPIGSVQLLGGHMLPEETTRIGYSVLSARRIPPHTVIAPNITSATRNIPLVVSFFLQYVRNFLMSLLIERLWPEQVLLAMMYPIIRATSVFA